LEREEGGRELRGGDGKRRGRRGGLLPLPVVSEDCVRLAECEKLFPSLGIVVYVRMELLAQLHISKQ